MGENCYTLKGLKLKFSDLIELCLRVCNVCIDSLNCNSKI